MNMLKAHLRRPAWGCMSYELDDSGNITKFKIKVKSAKWIKNNVVDWPISLREARKYRLAIILHELGHIATFHKGSREGDSWNYAQKCLKDPSFIVEVICNTSGPSEELMYLD